MSESTRLRRLIEERLQDTRPAIEQIVMSWREAPSTFHSRCRIPVPTRVGAPSGVTRILAV